MNPLTQDEIEQLAQDIHDAYLNGPDNPHSADEVEKIIRDSLENQDRQRMLDQDDDRRRWNDDEPKLNANARAEEEFGKRLEHRGPGER